MCKQVHCDKCYNSWKGWIRPLKLCEANDTCFFLCGRSDVFTGAEIFYAHFLEACSQMSGVILKNFFSPLLSCASAARAELCDTKKVCLWYDVTGVNILYMSVELAIFHYPLKQGNLCIGQQSWKSVYSLFFSNFFCCCFTRRCIITCILKGCFVKLGLTTVNADFSFKKGGMVYLILFFTF